MPGISCKRLPIAYTQKYFASEITRDTKQFVLDHFVNEGAQHYLSEKKLATVNWPRPLGCNGSIEDGFTFVFAISLAPTLELSHWKEQTFIAPKRKNYTDLDTQVSSFVSYLENIPSPKNAQTIEPGDWVRFRAQLRTPHATVPLHEPTQYWLNITMPHATTTCMESFVGMRVGQTATLPATALLNLQPDSTPTDYSFDVTIEYVMKTNNLPIESIQTSLHAPDEKSLHDKLIEVFSYRNDISLRKSIIEELFYMLLSTYRFDIAPHAITRRKELLLALMQRNPDNLVYTKQKKFLPHITLMAEAKLKEESLIDAIATQEQVTVTQEDITSYLALQTHDRLKEFLYFTPLNDDTISSDQPCAEYILAQTVRREKTLNMVIEQLAS